MSLRIQPVSLPKLWCGSRSRSTFSSPVLAQTKKTQRRLSTLIPLRFKQMNNSNPGWHRNVLQNMANKRSIHQIVDEGVGTHKPTSFQKKILVWGKTYPSVAQVPDRVTKLQLKTAMDKFRVRVSIMMVAATLVASAVMAMIGRRERKEGRSVTKMVLDRQQQSANEGSRT